MLVTLLSLTLSPFLSHSLFCFFFTAFYHFYSSRGSLSIGQCRGRAAAVAATPSLEDESPSLDVSMYQQGEEEEEAEYLR
jgi:hypothetical protein